MQDAVGSLGWQVGMCHHYGIIVVKKASDYFEGDNSMKSVRKLTIVNSAICAMLLIAALPVSAHWAGGTQMPIARLLKNIGDYLKAQPEDASSRYTLARVESAAFAGRDNFSVYKENAKYSPDHYNNIPGDRRKSSKAPNSNALLMLKKSISDYKIATELGPNQGLYQFGLAFEIEEALVFPECYSVAEQALGLRTPPSSSNADRKEVLRKLALDRYRKAFELSLQADIKYELEDEYVSVDAAKAIARLQDGRKLTDAERRELIHLKEMVAKVNETKRAITPIIISFNNTGTLSDVEDSTDFEDLIDSNRKATFDLSGQGSAAYSSWPKPNTGILVWDPQHTGKITSGLQLFGNATWWLFWKNGYEPLAALDNDHNGWLERTELEGLAVWFDRNGNGKSDPGEVIPVQKLGITRIAVSSAGISDGVLYNRSGVQFADGHTGATFDWVAEPVHSTMARLPK